MKSEKIATYTTIFEPAQEGGYFVTVPQLPGCLSQGETFEEAKENITDAIREYLIVSRENHYDFSWQDTTSDPITTRVSVPMTGFDMVTA